MNSDTFNVSPLKPQQNSTKDYPHAVSSHERGKGREATVVQKLTKGLYSIKEAAAYLGVSTWWILERTWDGSLPFIRLGKRKLIAIEDLEVLVMNHKEGRWEASISRKEAKSGGSNTTSTADPCVRIRAR
jgi:excisionase family DNA binding protein